MNSYQAKFILRGEIVFEATAVLPSVDEDVLDHDAGTKRRGRKPSKPKGNEILIVPQAAATAQLSQSSNIITVGLPEPKRGRGRQPKSKPDIQELEPATKKKQKRGRPRKISEPDLDEDEELSEDGSDNEDKLLELEGQLEQELAHVGENGEDVDNFDEEGDEEEEEEDEDSDIDEEEDSEKLENYMNTERPMTKLLNSRHRLQDFDQMSESNLSQDPNYQKLTRRQKQIVKSSIQGQIASQNGAATAASGQPPAAPGQGEYLELPSTKSRMGKKNVLNKEATQEDIAKKLERDEKRREFMQKQIENLKKQTVDKILNEAGTQQKKRKEKEALEKQGKEQHQYRQLPQNEPRIRFVSSATSGSLVSITSHVFHPLLNPNPTILNPIQPVLVPPPIPTN